MNRKERDELNGLTKEVIDKIEEILKSYRMKVAEVIEKEEEKAERLEEYFPGSPQQDTIAEDIEKLEDTLSVFEEAFDMMTGVEDV